MRFHVLIVPGGPRDRESLPPGMGPHAAALRISCPEWPGADRMINPSHYIIFFI